MIVKSIVSDCTIVNNLGMVSVEKGVFLRLNGEAKRYRPRVSISGQTSLCSCSGSAYINQILKLNGTTQSYASVNRHPDVCSKVTF